MIFICLCCLFGCGQNGISAPVENTKQKTQEQGETTKPEAVMSGLDFRLYSDDAVSGVAQEPTFWLHADKGSLGSNNIWSLEHVRVIIYSDDGGETLLVAGRGRYDATDGAERAYLSENVVLTTDTQKVELVDMEWINSKQKIVSDNPVHIISDEMELNAATMVFFPRKDNGDIELTKGKLFWRIPERKL